MAGRVDPGPTVAYSGRNDQEDSAKAGRADGAAIGVANPGRRFQIVRPHAHGGLGEVFVAYDRELNRSVALKELQGNLAHDAAAQARFLLEAEVTGSLEHPGIVPVYSLGRHEDGRPYYAMHLVEGETLRTAIERFHQSAGAKASLEGRELAFRRLLKCVIDACNAVAYAHSRGVIHRDLKPENIMLGRFGETLVVDWGLAKRLGERHEEDPGPKSCAAVPADESMTYIGSLIGTPRYMSPEQASRDLDRVAESSDVYSLGAILYCVLVGRDAFSQGDLPQVLGRVTRGIFPAPRRLVRTIDSALEAICLKAMALNPRDRYGTALEMAGELEAWLADVRYRREHEAALSQVKGTLARLCLERAHRCFEKQTHSEGMLWLARALENAPSSPPDLERMIRTTLSGWHTGAKLLERTLRHGCVVNDLAFCPDGRRLATAGEDREARLWDLATGAALAPPLKHDGAAHGVAFSPDGMVVATSADDGMVRRWDAWTGEPLGEPSRGRRLSAPRFSPDGSMFATAGGPGDPCFWRTVNGEPVEKPKDRRAVSAVAFAPDGLTIAVADHEGAVFIRKTTAASPVAEPLIHRSPVCVLDFDFRGTLLLTGTVHGEVCLWDVGRRDSVLTIAHAGPIRTVAFRPAADSFATVGADGSARLWQSPTGRPIGEPLVHGSRVECLAFRADGTMLATGSADGMVRLWCAASGLPIGPPLAQGGAVRTLAFSADGRRLASGGSDAAVRVWKIAIPVEGSAELVSCWVGVTTNLEFDAGDAVLPMNGVTAWELRRRLGELGGAPLK